MKSGEKELAELARGGGRVPGGGVCLNTLAGKEAEAKGGLGREGSERP